ncbi:hypothetical protein JB92DRAFT_3110865 [Gautieria morchelliformis]|nr:hypothetical protein JB92DRAFT_3110865 [Gautieria morchelliformis]
MPHTYLEDLVQNKKGTEYDLFSDDNPVESMSKLDKATKNYPVPSEYTDRFDAIKSSYSVNKLPVYYNDRFVPPHMTSRVLENAVIELHIGITHNYMRKDAEKFDSFNGNICEVNIYIPGSSRPLSPYKRKNPRDDPLLPSASASSSREVPEDDPSDVPEEGPSKKAPRRS